MNARKRQRMKEQLSMIEKRLANAHGYVVKNVNVEGCSFCHFGDWQGKSGHPLWMRNFMMPTAMKERARIEKALEKMENNTKDKNLSKRKRDGATRVLEGHWIFQVKAR